MAREYIPVAVDRLVHERAREQCEYCRAPADITAAPFNIEHIQPLARGGNSDESNLALACAGCNLAKGARTSATDPVTGRAIPLFHPRQQRWSEHFGWSEDFLHVTAHTPIGRATIGALDLNRLELRNLRRVLIRSEEHPPDD